MRSSAPPQASPARLRRPASSSTRRIGDEDDAAAAAASDHEAGGALGDAERRPQVAAEGGVERRLVALEQRAGGADREVGDGDVEAAEHAQQLAQRRLDLARPHEVGGDAVDGGAGGLELGLGHPRLLLVGRADDDAGAVLGQPTGDRRPDAVAAAGDERRLVLEAHRHLRVARVRGAASG